MSRISSYGFELNSATAGVEFEAVGGSPTVQSTTVRSGTYALQITSLVSATRQAARFVMAASAGNGPFFVRFYFRADTLPSAENTIHMWNSQQNYTTEVVRLTIDNLGVLRLYDEDGQITGTTTLSTSTWYRVEVKIDRTPAAGSQIVEGQVDGVVFATSSTRDLSETLWVFALGGKVNAEAQTNGNWYFDDVAANDSGGSFETGYPGEGEVIHLRPSATGDNDVWTGTFADIDEVTPDDATTLISSNTSGDIEDVNIDATPVALASDDTINVVHVGVRRNVSDATGGDPNAVLRIEASAGGTVEESANIGVNNITWRTNSNDTIVYTYLLTLYDLPGASAAAWTKTDLDAAQIGVRETATDTHLAQVSTLWLLVDHKPSAGGAQEGAASLSGTATATIAGKLGAVGLASLAATGTETVSALRGVFGSSSLTATGTETVSGLRGVTGTSSLTVTATETVAGLRGVFGDSSATGTATLTISALRGVTATSSFSATATLTAVGTTGGEVTGSASLTGTATETVSAILGAVGSSTLTGTATFTVGGLRGVLGIVSLSGTATQTVSGLRGVSGSLSATATGSLTVAGLRGVFGTPTMTGTGTLTVSAILGVTATSSFSAVATLTATGTTGITTTIGDLDSAADYATEIVARAKHVTVDSEATKAGRIHQTIRSL